MTNTTTTTTTAPETTTAAKPAFQQATANEWGQISGLESHATYFVIKRPTLPAGGNGGAAATKGREFVDEVKSFLHEHKVLTQKQLEELKSRYGNPADKAREVRTKVEQKFDEVARELETRYEKLEAEVEKNLDRVLKRKNGDAETPTSAAATSAVDATETPGELPRGDDATGTPAEKPKKKAAKKTE